MVSFMCGTWALGVWSESTEVTGVTCVPCVVVVTVQFRAGVFTAH